MARAIYSDWLGWPKAAAAAEQRGVHANGHFASWRTIRRRAEDRAALLPRDGTFVVDTRGGIESIVSLLAVYLSPGGSVIWAVKEAAETGLTELAPALFLASEAATAGSRPVTGIATSGSSGRPKIAMAYSDTLELVALHYDRILLGAAFDDPESIEALATCLPLEYSAVFLSVIITGMFTARDIVLFPPDRWDIYFELIRRRRAVCLAVPALIGAACAATAEPIDAANGALMLAAAHLSAARIDAIRGTLNGVRLLFAYGTTETGFTTVDRNPTGKLHVGQPLYGKPVWIADPDSGGIGRVATTGVGCSAYYWRSESVLSDANGVVAVTDLGHLDPDGNLYLDGRIDGAEKLHGMLIYPRQIERHILLMPGAVDARVSVAASAHTERLTATVVGAVTEDDVREHCRTLPERSRPAIITCIGEEAHPYSARGKMIAR